MDNLTRESFENFYSRMLAERNLQLLKWGFQPLSYEKWLVILAEEFGELAKAICERNSVESITIELVQIASVCQAIYQEGHY